MNELPHCPNCPQPTMRIKKTHNNNRYAYVECLACGVNFNGECVSQERREIQDQPQESYHSLLQPVC